MVGYERFHCDKPSAEGGAVLFSELGCANCHGGSEVVIPRSGPNLVDLSKRVDRSWVIKFLNSPSHGHSGSTMPSMFAGMSKEERDASIDSVVAWLATIYLNKR